MAEKLEAGEVAQALARLVQRLLERNEIRWSAPDKDGGIHQLVDGNDLLGAIYALSAYLHRFTATPDRSDDALAEENKRLRDKLERVASECDRILLNGPNYQIAAIAHFSRAALKGDGL